jgi:3-dehydroquinate synthase
LPTRASYNLKKALSVLRMDKKRQSDSIQYVLLQKIGKAVIHSIRFDRLEKQLAKQQ